MPAAPRLELTRAQILAYRRSVGALDAKLPAGPESLRRAASAGLQDSMPRAALLSIHARVEGATSDSWEDPALVQVWGPRYSTYVVAEADVPVFTLGRLPGDERRRERAVGLADRLEDLLEGRPMTDREAGQRLGVHSNELRYAAPTGRVLLRWPGAGAPTVRTVPAPDVDPVEARSELLRRYLQVFGPATPESFARWAGIGRPSAGAAFGLIEDSLLAVATPVGDAWIAGESEPAFLAPAPPTMAVRLLPSGDTYFLLQGADRDLLVPEPAHQERLWTSRVWPGAVLVGGEVAGTWRRAGSDLTLEPWRRLTSAERDLIESEAASLPLPAEHQPLRVHWG